MSKQIKRQEPGTTRTDHSGARRQRHGTKSGPGRIPLARKSGTARLRAGTGPGSISEFDRQMAEYLRGNGERPTRQGEAA